MTLKVGLLGATGKAGGWVLETCLERDDFEVFALVRKADKLSDFADKITVVEGDATTVDGIKSLLSAGGNLDVVISTLGSPSHKTLIMKPAAEALVAALEPLGETMPRIVWMTSTGINEATNQAKSYPLFGSPSRWFFGYGGFGWLQFNVLIPFVIGQDLWDDMGFSEDVIRANNKVVPKTVIVRPGNMWPVSEHAAFSDKWRTEGGEDLEYELINANDPPAGKWIWRKAIAAALVSLAKDDSHDGTAKSLFQNS